LKSRKATTSTCLLAIAWLLVSVPAQALETDQFYAWGKPIEDSSDLLNAWVRLTVQAALDSKAAAGPMECEQATRQVKKNLQEFIYQPIEMWVISTSLVDRVPKGREEDRHYRKNYLLSSTVALDFARWLQPSPTLQVNGIRIGSDKLAHFFSEGLYYYKKWEKNRDKLDPDELQAELLEYGVIFERWFQGTLVTGVLSIADLEANYQGFFFYYRLCHGDEPLLYQHEGRWHISDAFDIRDYVSPEWDESWNPNIYSGMRWNGIRKIMQTYCPMLHSPWVEQQRAHYREIDTRTPIEIQVEKMVAEGKLADPQDFDITTICAEMQHGDAP